MSRAKGTACCCREKLRKVDEQAAKLEWRAMSMAAAAKRHRGGNRSLCEVYLVVVKGVLLLL